MNKNLSRWLLFTVLCIIWGSSFKMMKDSGTALLASQIAALRIFAAGLVFVPLAIFHIRHVPRKKIGVVILSAVFGNLLPAFFFAAAMQKIDGSLGGILNALTPISVVITGISLFGIKTERRKIIGVLIGFSGLILLTLSPVITGEKSISFDNAAYILLAMAGTLLYGININMVGKYMKDVHPIHAATVSLAFMTIPTLLVLWQQNFFSLDFSNHAVRGAIGWIVLLGVLGSAIATALFYALVRNAGGLFASLVTYGIPFVALGWGLYDHEVISWLRILCLLIILLGVYLANRTVKKSGNV